MIADINIMTWSKYLEIKGLKPRSIQEYNNYLMKINPINLSMDSILTHLHTYNNRVFVAMLRNVFAYIKSTDYPKEIKDEVKNIEIPKITGRKKKRIPDVITEQQMMDIEHCMPNERDKLILLVSFYGGLRPSEIVGKYAIKPYSLNWTTWVKDPEKIGIVRIIGKGDKQRTVFLQAKIMLRLFHYIKSVAEKQSKDDPIFNIGHRRWHNILASVSHSAIGRTIYPHLLRHSCSMFLKSQAWDIADRKSYLGHDNISTTAIYDRVYLEDLKERFSKFG